MLLVNNVSTSPILARKSGLTVLIHAEGTPRYDGAIIDLARWLAVCADLDNFSHIGLLHLILPNAKIINARRHPLERFLLI